MRRRATTIAALAAAAVTAALAPSAARAAGPTFVVDSNGDAADANPGDGVCATAARTCTLRAAIAEGAGTGATIRFDLPSGATTITPASALPTVDDTTIDGTTQPGFVGLPVVELDGHLTGGAAGLDINRGSTVRGLVINRFGAGIVIGLSSTVTGRNTVQTSFIGTDVTGTVAEPNGDGIRVEGATLGSGAEALIGGPVAGGPLEGPGNLISGNTGEGIRLDAAHVAVTIQGNLIGTALNGAQPLPNRRGIREDDGVNTIGGTGAGNVISGNTTDGVLLDSAGCSNDVEGNAIGTDLTGTLDLGNGGAGVDINNACTAPHITVAGGNLIAFNATDGISVATGGQQHSPLWQNGIFSNGRLGIDLGADGVVTPNDAGDGDSGPNRLQNFPLLSAPSFSAGIAHWNVSLNSVANTSFRIAFYSSNACDGSGHGEGAKPIQSTIRTTDGSGNVSFAASAGGVEATPGHAITATATRQNASGDLETSEFSNCVTIPFRRTFVVTSTGDSPDVAPGNGVCATASVRQAPCTLRAAIQEANASAGLDRIAFSIGSGAHTIAPATRLPAITESATIDGSTQPGFAGDPLITVDGGAAGASTDGLTLSASSVTVKDLDIVRFGDAGIDVDGALATIQGNFVGLTTGNAVAGNRIGIDVTSSGGSALIGGSSTPGVRNVVAGNDANGIVVGATGARIAGNLVGVGKANAVLGNGGDGVLLSSADSAIVGSNHVASPGVGNTIAGNGLNGIEVVDSRNVSIRGNVVRLNDGAGVRIGPSPAVQTAPAVGGPELDAGNTISQNGDGVAIVGIRADGTAVRGNVISQSSRNGVFVSGAPDTAIGGATPQERNVISSNGQHGVVVAGTGATGVVLHGNFVGTDATGELARPNGGDGIYVAAPAVEVGGSGAGEGNLLTGNRHAGVSVNGAVAAGTTVLGNVVGLGADGRSVGNGNDGVALADVPNVTVGGAAAGEANVISGNGSDGVQIGGAAATGNVVAGNLIGTDPTGLAARGNGAAGVRIVGAPGNTIGGTLTPDGNTIAGNGGDGVLLSGAGATGNTIASNDVGLSFRAAPPVALANGRGIDIAGAASNTIGGQIGQGGNRIGANTCEGILVQSGAGNTIGGNLIGTDLPNGCSGVFVKAPTNVGGDSAARNVISGNGQDGVRIQSDGVTVSGNYIGVGPDGVTQRANLDDGILVLAGRGVVIGGPQPAQQNVIGGNRFDGINVQGGADGIVIQSNLIGTAGGLGAPNGGDGIDLRDVSGATIGGPVTQAGDPANVIAHNAQTGVLVEAGVANSIQNDSLFANGRLGIDLGSNGLDGDGVTPNDPLDADTGANSLQNFPVLTDAVVGGGVLTLDGTLDTRARLVPTLDVYASPSCDPSGNGEGQTFVGEVQLPRTDASGHVSFPALDLPVTGLPVPPGSSITVTATDGGGNTSEFSSCVVASDALADLGVTLTASPEPVAHGADLIYTITVTNLGPAVSLGTTLAQTLGKQLVFQSATTPQGSCDPVGNRVVCDLGTLAPSASVVVTVVARTTTAGSVTNTATVTGARTDPSSGNNAATATSTVT